MDVRDIAATGSVAAAPGRGEADGEGIGAGAPRAAVICARLATFAFAFVLPMLMVVANKSAPASFAAAALLANAAVLLAGRGALLLERYRAILRGGTASATAAVVLLCLVSVAWSVAPGFTLRGLVEGLPELVFALAMAAAWPIFARPRDTMLLAAGLVGAMALVVFEQRFGMKLHALVHARGEAWDLKRSAIPPVLLLWPVVEYCCGRGRPLAALAVALSAAIGIVFSHSGAPGLALLAAVVGYGAARRAPRATLAVCGLGLALVIVSAPWTGTIAQGLMPASVENALSEEHAAHRIRIWSAFQTRMHDRPWLGHGFNSVFAIATVPRPGGLPLAEDNDAMVDIHPHDIALQIWVEFGLVGGIAAALLSAFLCRRLARLDARSLAPRLGLLITVIGVGLVGLSAWQPWWIASIAAALVWFEITRQARAPARSNGIYP